MKSGCAKNERAREETVDKNYIEMGFAKIDSGRKERTGFAETIFCQGKADQYLVDIFVSPHIFYEFRYSLAYVFLTKPLYEST